MNAAMVHGRAMRTCSAAAGGVFRANNKLRSPQGVGRLALKQSRQHINVLASGAAARAGGLVVVTREAGKNDRLCRMLEETGLSVMEMPLIESVSGPDRHILPEVLKEDEFDWIVLTSPESASVFLEGWRQAGEPTVRLAVVGEGTGVVLEGTGLEVDFVPSQAHAVAFSAELPGSGTVLYPASAKASTVLQDGLAARGFKVWRINTYSTVAVSNLEEAELSSAARADVITIGSPSAVKAWVKLAGQERAEAVPVACIGETSAKAARELGLPHVFRPEAPGLEGWVDSIHEALSAKDRLVAKHS